MKTTKLLLTPSLLHAGLALALLGAGTTASAITNTWTGAASTNWNTAGNWSSNAVPVAADDVVFDGTGINVGSIGLTAQGPLKKLTFTAGQTTAVNINTIAGTANIVPSISGGSLVVAAGSGNHKITGTGTGSSGSSRDFAILGSLTNFTFDIGSGTTFEINGRVGGGTTSATYEKNGAGTLILSGLNGGGSGWQFNAVGGLFSVNQGVLRLANSAAYGNSGNKYTVASGAALELSGGFVQTVNAGTITLNGTGIGGAGALRSLSGINSISGVQASGVGGIVLAANSSIGVDAGTLTINQAISGAFNLTKVGAGTLVIGSLNPTNTFTYSGLAIVNAGTLTIITNLALQNSTGIAIAAGATYDVSAITNYNLSSSTTLSASGTGTTAGTDAAVIKGGATVSLGSQGITLAWGGATSGTVTTSPCLVVSQGALTLNNNAFTINGATLDVGTYTLISVTGGTISGTPLATPTGTAIDGTKLNVISVSGGSVFLTVSVPSGPTTTTTVSRLTGSDPSTYGSTLTFKATIVPGSGSDVPTGTVQFKSNGVNYGSPVTVVTDSSPNGKAEISADNLPYNASAYTITAVYTPSAGFQTSSDLTGISQTINQAPVTVSGAAAQSKMFDGTTAATITGTLVGVLPADSANVTLNGTGTFASAAVGSGISVTANCTLGGSAGGNYSLTQPAGPFSGNILDTGIWSNPAGGLWNTAANWTEGSDNVVATGTNNTADFNQVSLSADTTVTLDVPITIGNLIFGNTAVSPAANWILNSNGIAANKLTLAGTNPTVTVNNLGSGKTATISAVVDGTNGLTKSGIGTLALDNRANLYTGNTVINLGILQIGNGVSPTNGSLGANSSAFIANGAVLLNNRPYDGNTANVYLYSGKLSGSGTFRSATGTRLDFINTSQPDSTNLTFEVNGSLNTRTNGFPITQIGELTGSGTVGRGGNGSSSEITYVIGAKNTDSTFSGAIVNSTVQKVGSGKLTLTGTNAYAGITTISDGTFEIGGAGRIGSGNYVANITNNGTFRHNSTAAQTIGGVISGGGILIKTNSGTLTLGGANTYTGATTISGGTLVVNGTIANSSGLTVAGGTLAGTGSISAPVVVNTTGNLAPGDGGIGTLSVLSNLTLNGTTTMELAKTGPTVTNDQVSVLNTLTLGGTLDVSLTGTVTGGEVFQLFTAGTIAPSAFSATNLPGLPGGLTWDTSNLGAGTLAVSSAVSLPPAIPLNVVRAGDVLTFSWTNAAFRLQSQTNSRADGLKTNWFDYPGGGTSPVLVTNDPANPTVFFRLVTP